MKKRFALVLQLMPVLTLVLGMQTIRILNPIQQVIF